MTKNDDKGGDTAAVKLTDLARGNLERIIRAGGRRRGAMDVLATMRPDEAADLLDQLPEQVDAELDRIADDIERPNALLEDLPMRQLPPGEAVAFAPSVPLPLTGQNESRAFLECARCGSTRIDVERSGHRGFVQSDPTPTKCRDCGDEGTVGGLLQAIVRRACAD